jgi:ATP-dependent Lon protease
VLKAMRLVLVDHMDQVLREALTVSDPDAVFGTTRSSMEYRGGELVEIGAVPPIVPAAGDGGGAPVQH